MFRGGANRARRRNTAGKSRPSVFTSSADPRGRTRDPVLFPPATCVSGGPPGNGGPHQIRLDRGRVWGGRIATRRPWRRLCPSRDRVAPSPPRVVSLESATQVDLGLSQPTLPPTSLEHRLVPKNQALGRGGPLSVQLAALVSVKIRVQKKRSFFEV